MKDYKELIKYRGILGLGDHAAYLGSKIKEYSEYSHHGHPHIDNFKNAMKDFEDLIEVIKKEFNLDEII